MLTLRTDIQIAATPERVWNILMDFPAHAQWNPFVRSIEGTPLVGTTLKVFIHPPGGRGMQFRPKVLTVEAPREFRWKGKLLIPGLFDGEHFFLLDRAPNGNVLFTQGEIFSGVLVPMMRKSLEGPTRAGFIAMNEALKRRAEQGPDAPSAEQVR